MTNWLIEPIDPLIVRDGKPFGPTPGARARTLAFPFPQTIAGAIRTRDGLDDSGRFNPSRISEVLKIAHRGPLLVELDESGQPARFLFPAPADALPFSDGKGLCLRRLEPKEPPPGVLTDLPAHLALIGMVGKVMQEKPAKKPPTFWYWDSIQEWLSDPQPAVEMIQKNDLGISRLPSDTRMHVGIRPTTQTADEENGALFMTAGLAFHTIPFPDAEALAPKLSDAKRYALFLETDARSIKAGLAPLGGERRTMQWQPVEVPSVHNPLVACPDKIKTSIVDRGACRIILATPAYFEDVTRPAYLQTEHGGVTATVQAIAVARSETVSGWDFARQRESNGRTIWGEPKPTRRLAPAGTVLWVKLAGDKTKCAAWVDAMWLQSISDDDTSAGRDAAQYRRDGYGLALLGSWDGQIKPWESEL